jgi:hypothetical protein
VSRPGGRADEWAADDYAGLLSHDQVDALVNERMGDITRVLGLGQDLCEDVAALASTSEYHIQHALPGSSRFWKLGQDLCDADDRPRQSTTQLASLWRKSSAISGSRRGSKDESLTTTLVTSQGRPLNSSPAFGGGRAPRSDDNSGSPGKHNSKQAAELVSEATASTGDEHRRYRHPARMRPAQQQRPQCSSLLLYPHSLRLSCAMHWSARHLERFTIS